MKQALEWIILITENYDTMKTFYKDALSFPIERDIPEEEFTQFKTDNCFITIFGKSYVEKLLETPVVGKPGSTIYSLQESNNVDSDYQQLVSKGVQFIQKPKTQVHGQRTAFFKDPDGNIWELQQWIKK
jgi:uncharacterized glyoxalase superfamily protein PhnB